MMPSKNTLPFLAIRDHAVFWFRLRSRANQRLERLFFAFRISVLRQTALAKQPLFQKTLVTSDLETRLTIRTLPSAHSTDTRSAFPNDAWTATMHTMQRSCHQICSKCAMHASWSGNFPSLLSAPSKNALILSKELLFSCVCCIMFKGLPQKKQLRLFSLKNSWDCSLPIYCLILDNMSRHLSTKKHSLRLSLSHFFKANFRVNISDSESQNYLLRKFLRMWFLEISSTIFQLTD